VTSSVHARVDELLEHHAKRLDDAYAIVKSGASTSYGTAALILDPFNRRLAVLETAAQWGVLVLQDRLTSAAINGVERYTSD
jgi:hypothetical protein